MPRFALPMLVCVGCHSDGLVGDWLGVCDAAEADARVLATVTESEDTLSAQVTVNRADRADLSLVASCASVDERRNVAHITACRGAWDGTDVANDLSLTGTISKADPVPVMLGDCEIDGLVGQLELWRIP